QFPQTRFDVLIGKILRISEYMRAFQRLSSQFNMMNARIPFSLNGLQLVFRHSEDANLADIPLQQGIRRLGRPVGNEDDLLRVRLDFPNQMLQALHHPFSYSVFMMVRSRDFDRSNNLQRISIDCDSIGKGSPHINPNSNATIHNIPPSVGQSNSGNMKMVRIVPIKPNNQA